MKLERLMTGKLELVGRIEPTKVTLYKCIECGKVQATSPVEMCREYADAIEYEKLERMGINYNIEPNHCTECGRYVDYPETVCRECAEKEKRKSAVEYNSLVSTDGYEIHFKTTDYSEFKEIERKIRDIIDRYPTVRMECGE